MKQLLVIVLVVVVLALIVWLVMRHNRENFGGGHGGGFHGGHSWGGRRDNFGRGYRGSGYDWLNYYPYWNSYDDGVRSCISNSVMGCGNSKLCYDNAINMCT